MAEKADIRELAVASWRLEKWLDNLNVERKQAAKSALRSIKKYIAASGVEIHDPLGSKFDPGLAIEVVNNESEEADESDLIIVETISPYIYQNGQLIQHARVIIGTKASGEAQKKTETHEAEGETVIPTVSSRGARDTTDGQEIETLSSESKSGEETGSSIGIREEDIERMLKYAKIL